MRYTPADLEIRPFKILTFTKFLLLHKPNSHVTLIIRGIIDASDEPLYLSTHTNDSIEIDLAGKPLFRGIICKKTVDKYGDLRAVQIIARSNSIITDQCERSRSFQCVNSYDDIFDEIESAYSKKASIHDFIKDIGQPDHLLVQYHETDWEFCKRIASQFRMPLIADCQSTTARFGLGLPFRASQATTNSNSYRAFTESGKQIIEVEDDQLWQLCQRVEFQGQMLLVYRIYIEMKGAVLVNRYHLISERDFTVESFENNKIVGVSLSGRVKSIKRDTIKVSLDIDGKPGRYDFVFATVYSSEQGGWYVMPEKGDQVNVYFPDSAEINAYAVSAIHHENSDYRFDPSIKRLRHINGSEIVFAPDYLLLRATSGSYIKMYQDGKIEIAGDNDINFSAGNSIDISTGGQVTLDSGQIISLRQGNNLIAVDEDITMLADDIRMK